MPRYQFNPRANVDSVDLTLARQAAAKGGGKNIREAFPMMGSKTTPEWRGTNQPRTITFTAVNDDDARRVGEIYGSDTAFIWNITELHYA